ncbi:MAG: hypothetical protein KBT30_02220 [Clostridiales bacterium]|nr:hypothetical protein [Candidatus Apopatousia equi]
MKNTQKFLIIFVLILISTFGNFSTVLALNIDDTNLPSGHLYQCYKYSKPVPHFFTHQIINDPKKAFNSRLSHHYDKDCITHTEFENFLTEMYNNNYCLVDIYDVVGYDHGKPYFKELFVPLGKKPFLLSFDDMSYDTMGLGLSDKIILDENGNIASFTESNNPQVEYDKEAICLLESFIKAHPDFSHNGARAIICPTGYNGILGYRINKESRIDRQKQIEEIKPLIKKLKELNYHFASHTFNHIQVAYSSDRDLYLDLKKYQDEIISIIGKTDILSFPCGASVSKGSKLDILKSFGYNIFFLVGDGKNIEKNEAVFLKREVLNGVALRNYRKEYMEYFDTKKVYDKDRTIPFPN